MKPPLLAIAISTACAACAAEQVHTEQHSSARVGSRTQAGEEAAEARVLVARAEAALRENRAADAEKLLLEAIEETKPDARTLNALARARIAQGKREAAIEDLGRSIATGESVEALVLRGRLLGLARRFDDAERDLQRSVELAPKDAHAWAVLGAVEINRGDDVEAERAFAEVVKLLGKVVGPDRLWTQLLSMPPDPIHPQESLDRCTRGRVALLEGRWVDAHAEQLNGLRYSPGFLWCIAGLAEAAWRVGGVAQAERSFRAVIAAYPQAQAALRADAQGKLAAMLVSDTRRAADAADLARSALEVRGDRGALLDTLARACDATGDTSCTAAAYRRLLQLQHVPEPMRARAKARLETIAGDSPRTQPRT